MDGSCSSRAVGPTMPIDSPQLEAPGDCLGPTPGDALYNSYRSSGDWPKEQVLSNGDGIELPQKVLFPPDRLDLKWTQVHRIGAGLKNMGNTCFLNSALQCLTYTPPFANFLLTGEHSKTCAAVCECGADIICSFIEPILMEGSSEFRILKDKWTAVSADDKRSAQFEHTVVITSDGVDILTKLPEESNL
ncbi:unnamed protein product [Pleuronectes platessa]|uniref:USP domain-containing protein n=1 Tax=Pleuronectes platessa TaxID=8262 RepID=A0A9N7V533_PLEPL|nr:unnamed protein product [Pleuronectes platessa]